ncbi:hypothetical protein PR202_gb17373 [Eleusine coracana subsp. coracana]|uniref:Uncharacterized protein n=1 Tax=Eleusine coracana subsp. coracana TaxID=191504 RepID=A0AAV5F4K5_ELECO|nr:hypothetical protein PR202_gb17373 [Eleusine coracana subsp. coracana]
MMARDSSARAQDGKITDQGVARRPAGGMAPAEAILPTSADCLCTFLLPKNYVEVRRHSKRTWVRVRYVAMLAVSPDGAETMYSVS